MTISIIVPVYGVERYIERCAVSLFEQTYADLEFLFVDDHTPDRSVDVLRSVIGRYPHRRPQTRILRNDKNRGVGYVRARAVAEAKGDCVMFVDSDDCVPHDAAERLARCMELTGADLVDGAYQEISQEGLSGVVKAPETEDKRRLLTLMLCQDLVPSHLWARLIRRGLFTENNINTVEGVDFAEDYSVMPRLLFHARRAVTDAVVYYYNVENTSSYTHSTTEKHVVSLIRSNAIVCGYFLNGCPDKGYRLAAQVGLLNMLRSVRRNGYPLALADRHCGLHATHPLLRVIELMMRGRCPLCLAEAAFLVARRIVARL